MKKYNVQGMSCAACSQRVERAVSNLEGVTVCSVNLLTNSMTVEGDASPDAVIEAVEKAVELTKGSKKYPVHYTISNTSGEKAYEEFMKRM